MLKSELFRRLVPSGPSNVTAIGGVVAEALTSNGVIVGDLLDINGNGSFDGDVDVVGDVSAATFNGGALPAGPSTSSAGGNVQDLTVSGLSGTNKGYRIEGRIVVSNAVAADFTLQLNGSGADGLSNRIRNDGGATSQGDTADLQLLTNSSLSGYISFWGHVQQLNTGEWSLFLLFYRNLGVSVDWASVSGNWAQVGAVTSIGIHSSAASGIRTGSSIRVTGT